MRALARGRGNTGALTATRLQLHVWLHEDDAQRSDTSGREITAEEAQNLVPDLAQRLLEDPNVHDALDQIAIRLSNNERLAAESPHYNRLADAIMRNIFPNETSNRGLLCGLRSILGALHTAVNQDLQLHELQGRILPARVLRLMYRNFDSPERPHRSMWTADLEELPHFTTPNMPGDPTDARADFLRRRLIAMGWQEGTNTWDEEWRQMTTMNNFNIVQLQFILNFMMEQGLVDRQFSLGVVTGQSRPIL